MCNRLKQGEYMKRDQNHDIGCARMGFFLGILSVVGVCIPIVSSVLSVTAIVLGIKGKDTDKRIMAIGGIVLGGLSMLITIILLVFIIMWLMMV